MKIEQWTIIYTYLLIFIEQEPPNMSPIEKQKIMKEAQAYLNSQMYKCVKEKGYGVMLGKNLNTRWDILMATLHCIKIFTQVRFNKCYRAMYRYMFFSNLSMVQNFHVLIPGCKCIFMICQFTCQWIMLPLNVLPKQDVPSVVLHTQLISIEKWKKET